MADLLTDYLDESAELLANYAAPVVAVLKHPIPSRSWDSALVNEMTRYQEQLGAPKVINGNAGVFITGQQPGIFTGPLYTIYKAITALQLATRASKKADTAFVPVFWVGGDDHDFDEISRVHLLSKQHTAVPLKLEAETKQPALSIFRLPVPRTLHTLVDQAALSAPGSEFSDSIRDFLHESLDASANLSEWHARLMARLFRDTPLLIFTPEIQAARNAAIPVFEREIATPLSSTARLNEGGSRLEQAGYGAQVVKDAESCNFFVEQKNMRCRVRYVDGNFLLPDTGEKFSPNTMRDWLRREPECFTANVALRCVVQQQLFPVRAYVAGPGELAYWGQLKGVFEHFDTPMPIVYPRIRAVLTSLKTNTLLAKYGLRPENLNTPLAALEETALRSGEQDPSLALLEKRGAALKEVLQDLRKDFDALGKKGRGAANLATQFSEQVQQSMVHFEQNLLRADKTRTETVRKQLARLTTELAPERKPQERYYTIFSWLFQYGWDLVPRLMKELDHRNHDLQEVEL